MKPLTPAEVERIAALARLELSEPETRILAEQLGSILRHMDALRAAEADVVDATAGAMEQGAAPLRADRVDFDALQRALQEIAPAWEGGFFLVPRPGALDPGEGE